ncbi:MAG: hypothetical protein BWY83_01476 [bacterium ADurb.Bin478]|nr:MAG: hypothetical protein BWY83_01476 [bacterium ADurb.Bin478]
MFLPLPPAESRNADAERVRQQPRPSCQLSHLRADQCGAAGDEEQIAAGKAPLDAEQSGQLQRHLGAVRRQMPRPQHTGAGQGETGGHENADHHGQGRIDIHHPQPAFNTPGGLCRHGGEKRIVRRFSRLSSGRSPIAGRQHPITIPDLTGESAGRPTEQRQYFMPGVS